MKVNFVVAAFTYPKFHRQRVYVHCTMYMALWVWAWVCAVNMFSHDDAPHSLPGPMSAQTFQKLFDGFENGCTHAVSAVMSVKFDIRLSSPKPTKISPISFTLHSLFHSRARSCSAIFLWTFHSSIISRPSEIMPKLISWLITSLVLGWNLSPMLAELMAWCDDVNEREKKRRAKNFC